MYDKLYSDLSDFFVIPKGTLLDQFFTLRDMMELSDKAVNSVDVMEGFAEVIERNNLDNMIDIPVFTLEDKLSSIVESIVMQYNEKVDA